jgi:exosortase/archaeosortase family protein
MWMAAAIVPLALAGNLLRVMSVCIAAYYLGESKGWRLFHDISGFLMFGVMIGGLLGMEKILERVRTGPRLK